MRAHPSTKKPWKDGAPLFLLSRPFAREKSKGRGTGSLSVPSSPKARDLVHPGGLRGPANLKPIA